MRRDDRTPHLRVVSTRSGGSLGGRITFPNGLVVEMRRRPLDTFLEWVWSLGRPLGDELVVLVTELAPRALFGPDLPRVVDRRAFKDRVAACAVSAREEAGTLLLLTSLVDFVFRGRSSVEEWAAIRDLAADIAATGDDARRPSAADDALSFPLRSRHWVRAFASWTQLRQGLLSIEAIEDYVDDQLPL